jgi:putative effector of murein hydrolase LrgA (UPF0299 family)
VSGVFEMGSQFMPRPVWTVILLFVLVYTTAPRFFWLRWGLANFFLPGLALDFNPPDLSLSCS